MKPSKRERLGYWLERFAWLHGVLMRYDGQAPGNRPRYVNRVNGHCVLGPASAPVRHARKGRR